MSRYFKGLAILMLAGVSVLGAEDVKQWRGNSRNGVYKAKNLLKKWAPEGPKLLWSAEGSGAGYSSPVVTGNRVYLTGNKGKAELFTAFDNNGKQLWQVEYGKKWTKSYSDTRTTPTISGNEAFVISGNGEVACIDLRKKSLKWSHNIRSKFVGETGIWGTSESPLVVGNKVIYTPGGNTTTMVALNRKDGSLVWKTESLKDKSAYVSPLLIEYKGKKQIIGVTSTWVFGVNPGNGKIAWKIDYIQNAGPGLEYRGKKGMARDINTNTPVYSNGRLFVTSGYDHGGFMLKLKEDLSGVEVLWVTEDLDVHHGGAVLVKGNLYGSNWLSNKDGNWVCIDWNSGKKRYEHTWEGMGKGAIIAADGMLFCYEEKKGHLGLVKADPAGFSLSGILKIDKGSGYHWCHPVISNGILYIRRGNVLMAYKIS